MSLWLVTSFRPWLAHHTSNASEDLLAEAIVAAAWPPQVRWRRSLPVSFEVAPVRTIAALLVDRPRLVLCLGMAERRPLLCLERYGKREGTALATGLDLPELVARAKAMMLGKATANAPPPLNRNVKISVAISEDAGDFVCNALYFEVLQAIREFGLPTQALFVHVPRLTAANRQAIAASFAAIVQTLRQMDSLAAPTTAR